MRTVLVAGGAGFIGCNFIRHMLRKYAGYRIVNADALTYAGSLDNLRDVESHPSHVFVRADIRDRAGIDAIFAEYDVGLVVNFAAETHVDRSIVDPEPFLSTNVLGLNVLLDAAMGHWRRGAGGYRDGARFLQISTDEVYGALGSGGSFTEQSLLLPRNPYAASKAGADMLARAYFETHGLPVTVTRSANNYGPYQHPEKLIPLTVKNCIGNQPLPVYGDGFQVREWLHVDDHCEAIDLALHKGGAGEIYNIGGCEKTNLEVVRRIVSLLGKSEDLIAHVADRPGHDRRYATDSSKIMARLGWRPRRSFEEGLAETVEWYLEHPEWIGRAVGRA